MKFLFFLLVVGLVFLWLRSLLSRGGARAAAPANTDRGYASGPADSYANPHEPRDYDGGCRSPADPEAPGEAGGDGGDTGDSSGDSGGGGSD